MTVIVDVMSYPTCLLTL